MIGLDTIGINFFLRLIEFGMVLGMTVYWLSTMQRVMTVCHSVSRPADPTTVWLTLIPVFGFVWQFIAIKYVRDTIVREYARRGWKLMDDNPGMELGVVTGIIAIIVFSVRFLIPIHPAINFFGTLLVCFLMWRHIEQLTGYRERPEKEIDPATAFGQIPLNINNPFAQNVNQYLQNPIQNPFVPQQSDSKPDPYAQHNNSTDTKGEENNPNDWSKWAPKN